MAKLERYGLEWSGHKDFVAKPMPDGYWTPWHIAQAAVDAAILNWGGVAKSTRPTPPADAMQTEHAELRLLVRRLARRLPFDDKTGQQADDYLRRTFKASDVLRDDETVGKPEQTALQSPAPVTDAQREALPDDLWLNSHEIWINGDYWFRNPPRIDMGEPEKKYIRADLVQAKDAEIAKLKQERDLLARGVLDAPHGFFDEALKLARKIVKGEE